MSNIKFEQNIVKQGVLLSICNVTFEYSTRTGADEDCAIAEYSFVKYFGFDHFDGKSYTNLKITDWNHDFPRKTTLSAPCTKCVCCRIKDFDFWKYDCLVFTISSHGCEKEGETMISFVDGYQLPISEIYKAFDDESCPGLAGKPRLLFIQACRKDLKEKEDQANDPGVMTAIEKQCEDLSPKAENRSEITSAGLMSKKDDEEADRGLGDIKRSECRTEGGSRSIPRDFAVVYPTWSGRFSFRSKGGASWMETELKNVVNELKDKQEECVSFFRLTTMLSARIAEKESASPKVKTPDAAAGGMKNAVVVEHTLNKPVKLTVGSKKQTLS